MNFYQISEFANNSTRQSMGIEDISNLQMNVPVAHIMRSAENINFIEGTFVGNDTNYVDIQCPFEPNIALAFSEDLVTNPGLNIGMLVSVLLLKNLNMYNTLRYISATGLPTVGGGKKTLSWNYENGIFRLSAPFSGTNYNFHSGYTYKYYLLQ